MSALREPRPKWAEDAYLDFEATSELRHEFIGGDVIAMAGASRNHNLIVVRAGARLEIQLEKRPCEVYSNDMRVRMGKDYVYPDIVVVCGKPDIVDDRGDTLLNPTIIIEVLSPSTEAQDRGEKSWQYRALDSLQAYLLIAQDRMHIEHYHREIDKTWKVMDITDADAVIDIPSIGCTLNVADIYEKVTFDPLDEDEPT